VCIEDELEGDKAKVLRAAGAEIVAINKKDERIDLVALLEELPQHNIHSLMVEGGAQVITSFLKQGLADIAIITIAPLFVGGVNALTEFIPAMPRLNDVGYQRYGEDMVVWGRFKPT
jgi:riboflavin biosynthesis pyrimidine reductase